MNRLAQASSPYLRMHAGNPVDWHAWGEEAFAQARREDKPIFLSIGYYTCHWCHVMERESFSDPALAELLNANFVAIKVDREERPDVDRLYMTFVQATTGSGGWPLSAFLTPDLKPFYGGTYFPPRDRYGMPAFGRVLATLAQAWRDDRPQLLNSAGEISAHLARATAPGGADAQGAAPAELRDALWPQLLQQLRGSFDAEHGGFGQAPKFPRPAVMDFLLRLARKRGGAEGAQALQMALRTLRAMAAGGMHDALGGGFHRYSTDATWLVPHFEKMLYDQAQLASLYVQAWQFTHAPDLAATARLTLDFVLRELTSPEGGFYSAQDADSALPDNPHQHGEGAYYLWSAEEIRQVLGDAGAREFGAAFGVLPQGNVPSSLDPHGEFTGKNILYGPATPETAAARELLYQRRWKRPHPPMDDKILTSWNGLMLSALAPAGAGLDEARYVAAAQRAAAFLRRERWEEESGRLWRTPGVEGFAEDYAFLIQGLLDLYQADFDEAWLGWAHRLQQQMDRRLAAPEGGYYAAGEDPHLWLRLREDQDGAEPSPNSVALANLLRLEAYFPAAGFGAKAEKLITGIAARLRQMPEALPLMVALLDEAAEPVRVLTLQGGMGLELQELLRTVRARYLPGYRLRHMPGAPPAAFLCEDAACQLPVTSAVALAAALDAPYPDNPKA